MSHTELQLTPEQREALSTNPGHPIHIADHETRKVYMIVERGVLPELEDDYIREGLELARGQISRGELSSLPIADVISKAQQSSKRPS
jgi:hypothetical protein